MSKIVWCVVQQLKYGQEGYEAIAAFPKREVAQEFLNQPPRILGDTPRYELDLVEITVYDSAEEAYGDFKPD